MPIKILQLTTVDITLKAFLFPLLRGLRDKGYDVYAASTEGEYVPLIKKGVTAFFPIYIDRIISPFRDFVSLLKIYSLLKKEKFQVIHTHTSKAGFLGRLAGFLARTPLIIHTVHGFPFHENMHPLKYKFYLFMEKLSSYYTDFYFTVNDEDRQTAVNKNLCPLEKILRVYNSISLEKFNIKIDTDQKKKELGIKEDVSVVSMVAEFTKTKDYPAFLEVARLVLEKRKDVCFLAVGEGFLFQEMKNLANEMGLNESVIFAGYRKDVPEILAVSDVCVLTSKGEGLPTVLLEAMAMSKPVVANNVRGCREVVIDQETGFLVQFKDTHAMADAILTLLGNRELSLSMGKAGRQRVEREFDIEKNIGTTLEAYQRVIAEKIGDN